MKILDILDATLGRFYTPTPGSDPASPVEGEVWTRASRLRARLGGVSRLVITDAEVGAANGVAGLDGSGKVPIAQLPSGVASDLVSTLTAAEISITAAVTATLSRMHVISGTAADYTVALPTAVGNAGKLIGFRVAPYGSANKVYTIDANGAETINGQATLALVFANSLLLLSDGANWYTVSASLDTPATDVGAVQVDGTVSAPTIGTTTVNRVLMSRRGNSARLRYEVRQTVAGVGGSGEYLYRLPLGLSFASTVGLFSGAGPGASNEYIARGRAVSGMVDDGTTALFAWAVPYDATRFRVMGLAWNSASGYVQGSAAISWAGAANIGFGVEFEIPIAGW